MRKMTVLFIWVVTLPWLTIVISGSSMSNNVINSNGRFPPKERELHIAGIFPMQGSAGWIGGPGCLPAALMALADVNERPDILPGYHLNVNWNDSEVRLFSTIF